MVMRTFEDEMQRLKNEILDLGDAVKGSIVESVDTICWWVIFAATGGTAGVGAADRAPLAKMMPASAEYPPSSHAVPDDGSRAESICA